ncbi:MAG: Na+/H+ antiporter subunit E, partial [Candidatus Sericytochromatia bacterium]
MNLAPWLFGVLGLAVWAALVGPMAPADAVLGVLVVWSAWVVYRRFSDLTSPLPPRLAAQRAWRLTRYFVGYVAPEVFMSTLRVFSKVLSPRLHLRPAIT